MRRAFTLIELLVVVAIIGIVATSATLAFASGREGARLRGAARAVFATVRLARTKAFVTHQPCIVTYSTTSIGGEPSGRLEVTSAKIFANDERTTATTLKGELVRLDGGDEPPVDDRRAAFVVEGKTEDFGDAPAGETMEDILFAPIGDEVMQGVMLKVFVGDEDEEEPDADDGRARARISVFSNVDYLVGRLRATQEGKEAEAKKEEEAADASAASAEKAPADDDAESQPPVSVVWGVNGCCKPHRIWVYVRGDDYRSGLLITVDRFGTARIASDEDLQEARGGFR